MVTNSSDCNPNLSIWTLTSNNRTSQVQSLHIKYFNRIAIKPSDIYKIYKRGRTNRHPAYPNHASHVPTHPLLRCPHHLSRSLNPSSGTSRCCESFWPSTTKYSQQWDFVSPPLSHSFITPSPPHFHPSLHYSTPSLILYPLHSPPLPLPPSPSFLNPQLTSPSPTQLLKQHQTQLHPP